MHVCVYICIGWCYQGEHMVVRLRLCAFRVWIMQQKKFIKNVGEIERGMWNGSTLCLGRKVHLHGAVGPMGVLVKGKTQSCTAFCCSSVPPRLDIRSNFVYTKLKRKTKAHIMSIGFPWALDSGQFLLPAPLKLLFPFYSFHHWNYVI